MKKNGIINRELLSELAKLGHTQLVVIADCGLPCPPGVPVVDLSVTFGLPGFVEVTRAVLDEIVVEHAYMAHEIVAANPSVHEFVAESVCACSYLTHDEFKTMLPTASVIIRTGEATPYANVALRCGVPF